MWVIAGLRNKHGVLSSSRFHEVMRANIYHNLCAWINLRMQLLFQLPQSLRRQLVSAAQRKLNGYKAGLPSRRDSDPCCRFSLLDRLEKTALTFQDRVFLAEGSAGLSQFITPDRKRTVMTTYVTSALHIPSRSQTQPCASHNLGLFPCSGLCDAELGFGS